MSKPQYPHYDREQFHAGSATSQGHELLMVGKRDKITGFISPNFEYTALGKFILFRLLHDRDVKIIITGKGKTTGTGKTTLAIILAKWINKARNQLFDMDKEWSAEEYSFMNVWEYLKKYKDADRGDPLITDELEYMFDRRRSMANTNTKGTQAWSILRYKNVITIGTAPGMVDLDKRIPEGADIWINVVEKGRANVYYLTFDDFEWEPIYKRMKMFGYRETLLWEAIENDPDYQWLKETKEEIGVPGVSDLEDEITEKDVEKKESELLKEFCVTLLKWKADPRKEIGLSQSDIADKLGRSQQWVSQIKRKELPDLVGDDHGATKGTGPE